MTQYDHFHATVEGPGGRFEVEGGWNARIKPANGPRFADHELLIFASAWTDKMPDFDPSDSRQTRYKLVSFRLAG